MAYLGRGLDKISNIEVLDNITFDGSSSYSITKGSVAFTPNSAQSCLISIDGVVQATNFTVSSSTIDFGVAIPSTSVCNFFLHYGTGVMTVPSDGSVTTAKLGSNAVTSAKMFSGFKNGITMADQWRLTADTGNADGFITSNWERVDETSYSSIGTGLTESSGVFSFPQTGIYFIDGSISMAVAIGDTGGISIRLTTEVSGVDDYVSVANLTNTSSSYRHIGFVSTDFLYNVTDTSTHKFKFYLASAGNTSVVRGNTTQSETHFTVLRLGDST